MFKKISTRLITGFLIISFIGAALGIFGVYNLHRMNDADKQLYENNTMGIYYSSSAGTFFQRIRYLLLEMTQLETKEERDASVTKVQDFIVTIEDNLTKYGANLKDEKHRQQYDVLMKDLTDFQGYCEQIYQAEQDDNMTLIKQILMVDADKTIMDLKDQLEQLLTYNIDKAAAASRDNQKLSDFTSLIMYIFILIGVGLSVISGVMISRSISKPVKMLVTAADKLALGDVNTNINYHKKDEIGKLAESFSKMIDNIRMQAKTTERIADGDMTVDVDVRSENDLLGKKLYEMVHKNNELLTSIAGSSELVAVGARQVSEAGMALSQGATEQASAIEELTASLEQISSQTQLNAKNAGQANELAVNAKVNAIQGNSQMQEMLRAMEEINESSANISKVIKVIDDIAFQTNILALNAAVEAARAGQHGKGFAVVAEEVRNLAARSANAAKETTDMIESSIRKAEGGTRIAKDTADALNNIVKGIEKVAVLVSDIATASSEQAMGITQINQGISQVSMVVQTNSATSEESASASEQLSSQAMKLKNTVGQYKLRQNTKVMNLSNDISPEVLMMLEDMAARKRSENQKPEETSDKNAADKPKIILSDREFGKY
ncbi:MAG TPA: HAMP domain-containing methyl-accepting chemotaxis protein [Mobilitalea sp.]|nr:HAMP domain-containing methyl-accepting chemotaxis protein [Mobilitalea sp.]